MNLCLFSISVIICCVQSYIIFPLGTSRKLSASWSIKSDIEPTTESSPVITTTTEESIENFTISDESLKIVLGVTPPEEISTEPATTRTEIRDIQSNEELIATKASNTVNEITQGILDSIESKTESEASKNAAEAIGAVIFTEKFEQGNEIDMTPLSTVTDTTTFIDTDLTTPEVAIGQESDDNDLSEPESQRGTKSEAIANSTTSGIDIKTDSYKTNEASVTESNINISTVKVVKELETSTVEAKIATESKDRAQPDINKSETEITTDDVNINASSAKITTDTPTISSDVRATVHITTPVVTSDTNIKNSEPTDVTTKSETSTTTQSFLETSESYLQEPLSLNLLPPKTEYRKHHWDPRYDDWDQIPLDFEAI